MLIQVDVPKELNKNLKLEKIKRDLNTLQEAIIEILKEHFKVSK